MIGSYKDDENLTFTKIYLPSSTFWKGTYSQVMPFSCAFKYKIL